MRISQLPGGIARPLPDSPNDSKEMHENTKKRYLLRW